MQVVQQSRARVAFRELRDDLVSRLEGISEKLDAFDRLELALMSNGNGAHRPVRARRAKPGKAPRGRRPAGAGAAGPGRAPRAKRGELKEKVMGALEKSPNLYVSSKFLRLATGISSRQIASCLGGLLRSKKVKTRGKRGSMEYAKA